jgi:2-phosphosulfolactate phosphatase
MTFDQAEFAVRCEWGEHGVRQLAPISDVIIIVDVLSFSTCIDIATARGAVVYPWKWLAPEKDDRAQAFATEFNAALAGSRDMPHRYSLSPASLVEISAGTRLVLSSPNGATLSLSTGTTPTLAGCLRNCQAVAATAFQLGARIAVIPAGERWADGNLRPAVEDLVGAGAVIQHLAFRTQQLSPEARLALAAFESARADLHAVLRQCCSGKELVERGFAPDVELAAQWQVSASAPYLYEQAFLDLNKTL